MSPAWLSVILGLLLLAGALLAVDWFTAGWATRRRLMRARDSSATDADANYSLIERSMTNIQYQNPDA